MKISLSWLKQYVDISLGAQQVADRITMAGTEVKGIEVIGSHWEGIVVGRITGVNPHPNADRLTLVTIDYGGGEETVVCGASNVFVGAGVAFAPVGSELIDPRTGEMARLKAARIRGVSSRGMACSERELGISDSHEGIVILPGEAEVGRPLADCLGDVILDLDVTPNRPDCLSVLGLAREIAALTGGRVRLPGDAYDEVDPGIEERFSVDITAPDLCPRYSASLITGVRAGESPRWMQERLISYGMRPISNIVDITNFVMLEYGQPLHAFDADLIAGRKIVVRRAADGEDIVSLDGIERRLSADMLVIADAERPVAVAGVMGGANSEVGEATTSILLEAASFSSASIHYTARTLGMPSEASMRFERGISGRLTLPALKRATHLMADLCGGRVARGIIDAHPGKVAPKPISISTRDTSRLLGAEIGRDEMEATLIGLGFECRPGSSPSQVTATPPYWRSDVAITADLVEEVARIIGYDEIPMAMLSDPVPRHSPEPEIGLKREVAAAVTGLGFYEAVTHALVGSGAVARARVKGGGSERTLLRLVNPMTVDQECLRPDLRSNVIGVLAANQARAEDGIRLFELGRAYRPRTGDLPDEMEMLCAVMQRPRTPGFWQASGGSGVDLFDLKGVAEAILDAVGVAASFEPCDDETLRPGTGAAVVANGARLGTMGEIHPAVRKAFQIGSAAFLLELDLRAVLPLAQGHRRFRPPSRFPASVRDLAVVVDAATPYRQVAAAIEAAPLVTRVRLFDVYTGEKVPAGKKSLACRVTYQSAECTLTDDEINRAQNKILDRLSRELGATLRG